MLNFFKRKPKKIPNQVLLDQYAKKDHYFYRHMSWGWLNQEQIFLIDPNNPRIITMDPWPQIIFLNADGSKTIKEFIEWLAGEYRGKVPDTLVGDILDLMENLSTEDKTIELAPIKKQLPDDLLNPSES